METKAYVLGYNAFWDSTNPKNPYCREKEYVLWRAWVDGYLDAYLDEHLDAAVFGCIWTPRLPWTPRKKMRLFDE